MPLRQLLSGAAVATVVPTIFGADYSGNFFSHRRDGAGDTLTIDVDAVWQHPSRKYQHMRIFALRMRRGTAPNQYPREIWRRAMMSRGATAQKPHLPNMAP